MPSATGSAPPERPGPRAAGDERDAFAGAQAQHRLHLGGGAG